MIRTIYFVHCCVRLVLFTIEVVMHGSLNSDLVGHQLFCLGFRPDSPQRLRRMAMVKTRFMITSLSVHLSRIAVGDCRDGILFYTYQEVLQAFIERVHVVSKL